MRRNRSWSWAYRPSFALFSGYRTFALFSFFAMAASITLLSMYSPVHQHFLALRYFLFRPVRRYFLVRRCHPVDQYFLVLRYHLALRYFLVHQYCLLHLLCLLNLCGLVRLVALVALWAYFALDSLNSLPASITFFAFSTNVAPNPASPWMPCGFRPVFLLIPCAPCLPVRSPWANGTFDTFCAHRANRASNALRTNMTLQTNMTLCTFHYDYSWHRNRCRHRCCYGYNNRKFVFYLIVR